MNNKELLSKTISDMYERQNRLHIGQTVSIGDSKSGEGREHINKKRKGKIVGLYKNHFLVEFGKDNKYRESFSYIDIVTSLTNYTDSKDRGGERLFSAKFGKEYKRITIEMIPFKVNLGIQQPLEPKKDIKKRGKRNKENYRTWTTEQVKYIMKNKDNCFRQELADDFNLKFGTNRTREQINSIIQRERAKVCKL